MLFPKATSAIKKYVMWFFAWIGLNLKYIAYVFFWQSVAFWTLKSSVGKKNFNMEDSVTCLKQESHSLRLESLPNEILFLILEHLMPIDLISCYNTSTEMRNVVTRMEVFRNKCKLVFDIFNLFWVLWTFCCETFILYSSSMKLSCFSKCHLDLPIHLKFD